jgi:hypothetical protein
MSDPDIYSIFSCDVKWITDNLLADRSTLPRDISVAADYFLKERLIILRDEKNIDKTKYYDPEIGRPIPYMIMWLADAFNYTEETCIREIALGLIYSAIATTIKDDFYDEVQPSKVLLKLYDHYYLKYLSSFDLIENDSRFWYHLSSSIKQHKEYDKWSLNYIPEPSLVPLSDDFLSRSSQYFSAVVLPSMAAIAFFSGNEDKVDVINEFLSKFSKAWRIYDDFVDWEKDINKDNYNLNSILLSADKKHKSSLNKDDFLIYMLEEDFISEIYDKMTNYLCEAQSTLEEINGRYLDRFLLEQLSFHNKRKKILLKRSRGYKEDFFKSLKNVLR